jgi:adenosylhomocysteine nucleosidase
MIGIICAMEEELTSIVRNLDVTTSHIPSKSDFDVYTARYGRHELVFILCGIGKVNAAIHTQMLIDSYSIEYLINVGVAGSLSADLTFGDVVVASDLVEHDMDVSGFGLPLGQIPRMDVFAFKSDPILLECADKIKIANHKTVIGRIVSGDQFIDSKEKVEFLHSHFNALACEMEGAAIAHTCHVNNIPFIVIRALSDMAGRDGVAAHSFEELKNMTANHSSNVVKQLLALI